jgi:hypothetical protein
MVAKEIFSLSEIKQKLGRKKWTLFHLKYQIETSFLNHN